MFLVNTSSIEYAKYYVGTQFPYEGKHIIKYKYRWSNDDYYIYLNSKKDAIKFMDRLREDINFMEI